MVYRSSGAITHSTVSQIDNFLPQNTKIITNDTKVIKARLFGHKQSGGKIECVVIKPLLAGSFLTLIRGKIKIGEKISFDANLSLEVIKLLEDGSREVKFFNSFKELAFYELIEILEKVGHIPLPPYIHRVDEKSDEIDYQSRFAKHPGSVAAPTASLHFDEELLSRLRQKHDFYELTLHVGLGTFKSVDATTLKEHLMHSEYFYIPPRTAKLLQSDAQLLCIGTTAARTVEFFHFSKKMEGECDIFINPQNPPQRVDMLLTNFHLPKSTLIMLVSAFLGLENTLEIYKEAIENNYRFFSYGDAMLVL